MREHSLKFAAMNIPSILDSFLHTAAVVTVSAATGTVVVTLTALNAMGR